MKYDESFGRPVRMTFTVKEIVECEAGGAWVLCKSMMTGDMKFYSEFYPPEIGTEFGVTFDWKGQ